VTPVQQRLLRQVQVTDLDCWLWTGSKHPRGYGQLSLDGKVRRAHRVSFEIFVGPIPTELVLDHLCRNPACINPTHLEPVTQGENVRRGISVTAVNARKTHCLHGHAFTPANTQLRAGGGRACRACRRKSSWKRTNGDMKPEPAA
jgi:hypothetical protein